MVNLIDESQLRLPEDMPEQQDLNKTKYIGFIIGSHEYGIPVETLHEIISFRDITPLPQAPSGIVGIIDWRGRMINVLDINSILGATENAAPPRPRILITKSPKTAAIIVEATTVLMDIDQEECIPPKEGENRSVSFLYEHNNKIIRLLDTNILLSSFNKTEERTPGGENVQ
jgi:purine-binding chemotaxis protein CheW